jgi:hypothetical protein
MQGAPLTRFPRRRLRLFAEGERFMQRGLDAGGVHLQLDPRKVGNGNSLGRMLTHVWTDAGSRRIIGFLTVC